MMQELDNSFDAVVMIGYHSRAGAEGNPLTHTLSSGVDYIKINGDLTFEFRLHTYAASLFEVPVVFVSGDEDLCEEVVALKQQIQTLAVSRGIGSSTISISTKLAIKKMKKGVYDAIKRRFIARKGNAS